MVESTRIAQTIKLWNNVRKGRFYGLYESVQEARLTHVSGQLTGGKAATRVDGIYCTPKLHPRVSNQLKTAWVLDINIKLCRKQTKFSEVRAQNCAMKVNIIILLNWWVRRLSSKRHKKSHQRSVSTCNYHHISPAWNCTAWANDLLSRLAFNPSHHQFLASSMDPVMIVTQHCNLNSQTCRLECATLFLARKISVSHPLS